MSSDNLEAMKPLIDKVFKQIHSRVSELERSMAGEDQIVKAVCDYVTVTLTAESKSLLSTFYSRMADETLGKEPFLTTRNKNKFYDEDFRSRIFEKYSFSTGGNIDYKQANGKSAALPVSVGTAGLGVVLSIALSKLIILPIAIVIAAGLYYFISGYEKNKKREDFFFDINRYLNSAKSELIKWFENIEIFYNEQVEVLKQSINGGSNE